MQTQIKKRGWLTLAVVLIAIAGYLVYKYGYLVYQNYDYYAFYDDVHSLQIANPVFLNGVKVGEVSNIQLNGSEKVRVTLSIAKTTNLTKGTTAILASNGLRGDKMIFLEYGRSTVLLGHKSLITGKYDTTVMDMSDQVSPIIESAKYILNTSGKNFSAFNRKIDDGYVEKAQQDIKSMERSMKYYNTQLTKIEASTGNVINLIKEMRATTEAAHNNRKEVTNTIKSTENKTIEWANSPLLGQIDSLRTSVHNIQTQANAVANSDLGNKLLEKDKAYNDLIESAADMQREVEKIKKNAAD